MKKLKELSFRRAHSKIPVLVRDIGVYEDWLKDGENAYKARNNQEFIEKIKYIIHNDNSQVIKRLSGAVDRDLYYRAKLKKIYEGGEKHQIKNEDYYVLLALDEATAMRVRTIKTLQKILICLIVFYPHLTIAHYPLAEKKN